MRMRIVLWLVVFTLCSLTVYANKKRVYKPIAVDGVVGINDGDTFRVNIKGYPALIGEKMPVRIAKIDCPELDDGNMKVRGLAQKAREYTKKRLLSAQKVELVNVRRGNYFRILADVLVDGKDLGQELLKKGLAVPYRGSKQERKKRWMKKVQKKR